MLFSLFFKLYGQHLFALCRGDLVNRTKTQGQDIPLFSGLMNQNPTKKAGVKPVPTLTGGHEASCPYVLGKNALRIRTLYSIRLIFLVYTPSVDFSLMK